MTFTNNELKELEQFNFTNIRPSESIKSKCIQMSQRIKMNFDNINGIKLKSKFFVSKHTNEYKVIGIIVHDSESLVYYSGSKYLLIALKNVEAGLRKQINKSSVKKDQVKYRHAV